MNPDLSITALVLQASLVVQLVMAGLLITSLASWTVIFSKLFGLKRVRNANEEFEREFARWCANGGDSRRALDGHAMREVRARLDAIDRLRRGPQMDVAAPKGVREIRHAR